MNPRIEVGIDIGGTFSDVVAVSEQRHVVAAFKVHSTPAEPARAVLDGLRRLKEGLGSGWHDGTDVSMFHGTTIATNALIQKRGARTALLTTEGCRDVLALRRQARPALYRLDQRISRPLVPEELRREVQERLAADGSVLVGLQSSAMESLAQELRDAGVESVAVCLLHSYANPVHEREVARTLAAQLPQLDVSISAQLCPELGEFERTSTTVANAYVAPSVRRYLRELRSGAAAYGIDDFDVVKSNGGLTSSTNAELYPVHLIESGPAAGLSAVAKLGRRLDLHNLIGFDMGGTTAKIGVVQGGMPRLARELHADRYVEGEDQGGYVIKTPVVDVAEIGAGGGSIAYLDPAGVLKVGPESAGSDPGPACYGLGGDEPTVTDAHLVVGNLEPVSEAAPTGLDVDRARHAVRRRIADPLGWTVERAAHAILTLATATMAETVRLVTVRRGIDVRDFVLVAYGGAGPLHAADIAADIGIPAIVVPDFPAMFSAIGAVLSDVRHDLVHSMVRNLAELSDTELSAIFAGLSERAWGLLDGESVPVDASRVHLQRHLDLRHQGQLHPMSVPVLESTSIAELSRDFRDAYREQWGYSLPESEIEMVNARLEVVLHRSQPGAFPAGEAGPRSLKQSRTLIDDEGGSRHIPVIARRDVADQGHTGPVLVLDSNSTTLVRAGQVVRHLSDGAILIEVNGFAG